MPSSRRTLDRLRREIDQIDDEIHDLLIRRTAVVEKIRGTKGAAAGTYLRPAREATILRRLVARHSGHFPKTALVRIWREIMSALVRLQGPLTVAVFAPAQYPGYWDLARDHFGAATPMIRFATVGQVMRAVSDGAASVGVLPWPHESSPDPWWRHLASEEADPLRVIARLPFAPEGDNQPEQLSGVAIARMAQEPTGRDRSFFIFETAGAISRSRFMTATGKAGLDPRFLADWQDSENPESWLYLVAIRDFVTADDPRIKGLRKEWEDSITRVFHVGGFAEPLGEDELAGAGDEG